MQKYRTGKAVVSGLIVLVWIGAIAGGVGWYVRNTEAKKKAAAEKVRKEKEEYSSKQVKLPGLSMPPLTVPKGEAEKLVRTKPFTYVFSDTPPTGSSFGPADLKVKFPESKLSDAEYKDGLRKYLLAGVAHFKTLHGSKPDSEALAKILTEVIEESQQPEPDLTQFLSKIEPFVVGEKASNDPLVQHVGGQVYEANGDKKLAQQFLLGAMNDYQKYDYPSRFPVLAFSNRAKTKPKKLPTFNSNERHVDAIAHWLQEDFSEPAADQRYCWSVLKDSIATLAEAGEFETLKKLIDKNNEKAFISPWLAEMISAQYFIQQGKINFASDEIVASAKKHLNAAIEINPNFPEATEDLELVAKMANPGGQQE